MLLGEGLTIAHSPDDERRDPQDLGAEPPPPSWRRQSTIREQVGHHGRPDEQQNPCALSELVEKEAGTPAQDVERLQTDQCHGRAMEDEQHSD
jgi:hypothetical protein